MEGKSCTKREHFFYLPFVRAPSRISGPDDSEFETFYHQIMANLP